MSNFGANYWNSLRVPTGTSAASGGRVNTPLNGVYTPSVSGPGLAVRYQARSVAPITELYVFLDDLGGTFANLSMGCVLYNEHASSATQPGSTVRATASAVTMPTASDRWIKIEFATPYTPAIGEVLWFVLRNTAVAPTVDYPMIMTTTSFAPALNSTTALNAYCYSTTAGFSAAGTAQSRMPHVVVHSDGTTVGQPMTLTSNAIFASSTAMKGIQIRPPVDIEISGWQTGTPGTNYSGLRVYDAAVAPGGSPLYTFALGSVTNQSRDELIGAKIFSPIILTGGTTYNIVHTYGAALGIGGGTIEDYASFPAVFDAMLDDFYVCRAVVDAGGTWNYRKDGFPHVQFLVTDFPAPVVGGVRRPKIWNGSVWQEKPMGVWNGSAWEEQPLKNWNGSAWV